MRLLLDSCVWKGVAEALRAIGHDADWCGDWPEDPGDEEILTRAYSERRTLVTLDKDFGELAVLRALPHVGIIRLVTFSVAQQVQVCLSAVELHQAELESGAIITARPNRLRIRHAQP